MIYADYLVLISILALTLVNRQSIVFLVAFALCEAVFLMPVTDFVHSIFTSLMFSVMLMKIKINLPLKLAMLGYSILFWLSAISYNIPNETYLDIAFPYAVKLIDLFVIIYLIANREKGIARSHISLRRYFANTSYRP